MAILYTSTSNEIYGGIFNNLLSLLSTFAPFVSVIPTPSDTAGVYVDLSDAGSERDEIGVLYEQAAEFINLYEDAGQAARAQVLTDNIVLKANNAKGLPWSDEAALRAVTTYPGSATVSGEYSHFPNLFFYAALLTTSTSERAEFIQVMKDKYSSANDFFANDPTTYWKDLQERGWAWALRELSQLAFLEVNGLITGTYYQDALTANKNHMDLLIDRNESKWDHAINPTLWKDMYGNNDRASVNWRRSGWQQAFIGQTIAYINMLGFDWMNIATFHAQHWELRKNNWGWESVDYDYCFIDEAVTLYDALTTPAEEAAYLWFPDITRPHYISDGSDTAARDAALTAAAWDSALVVDNVINSVQMTFSYRLDTALDALGMYAAIGVEGAAIFVSEIKGQRQDRINRAGAADNEAWRHSIEWREIPDPIAQTTDTWNEVVGVNLMSALDPENDGILNPTPPSPWRGTQGQPAVHNAWNTAVYNAALGRVEFNALGGHNDYYGNESYYYDISTATFTRINNPSLTLVDIGDLSLKYKYDDGRIPSHHSWNNTVIGKNDRVWDFLGAPASLSGGFIGAPWYKDTGDTEFSLFADVDLTTNGTNTAVTTGCVVYNSINDLFVIWRSANQLPRVFDENNFNANGILPTHGSAGLFTGQKAGWFIGDITNNERYFIIGDVAAGMWVVDGVFTSQITTTGTPPDFSSYSTTPGIERAAAGWAYDGVNTWYCWIGGTTITTLTMPADPVNDNWVWGSRTLDPVNTVTPTIQTPANQNGIYGRLMYEANTDSLLVFNFVDENPYRYKL